MAHSEIAPFAVQWSFQRAISVGCDCTCPSRDCDKRLLAASHICGTASANCTVPLGFVVCVPCLFFFLMCCRCYVDLYLFVSVDTFTARCAHLWPLSHSDWNSSRFAAFPQKTDRVTHPSYPLTRHCTVVTGSMFAPFANSVESEGEQLDLRDSRRRRRRRFARGDFILHSWLESRISLRLAGTQFTHCACGNSRREGVRNDHVIVCTQLSPRDNVATTSDRRNL